MNLQYLFLEVHLVAFESNQRDVDSVGDDKFVAKCPMFGEFPGLDAEDSGRTSVVAVVGVCPPSKSEVSHDWLDWSELTDCVGSDTKGPGSNVGLGSGFESFARRNTGLRSTFNF